MRLPFPSMLPTCLLAAVLSVPSAAATAPAASAQRQFTLLYSADERGEIEPCG